MEDETLHMKMEGILVDILMKLDPKIYRKYITIENLRPVVYVELKKSLHYTLQAAPVF